MPMRLQLGAGRFENMDPKIVSFFANRSWVHLGDESPKPTPLLNKLRGKSLELIRRQALDKLKKIWRNKRAGETLSHAYDLTDFRVFHYSFGDPLPFADESFDFIYSEHFFEHLFLDEAVALFAECLRVMRPSAVIRTCVPDAELKTYEKPEFAGFPDPKMSFTDPMKHKTRWTVYSLSTILQLIGFVPTPLTYCTKDRQFIQRTPDTSSYPGNPDVEMVTRIDYIERRRSLIVDGQKPH